MHPLGRPITAEDCAEAAVYLVSDRAANVTGVLLPVDGGYVATMTRHVTTPSCSTVTSCAALFDLRSSYNAFSGGDYTDDPYPIWRELREQRARARGHVHELTGYPGDAFFHGLPFPDRPHFSAFSFEACDAAYRDADVFASSPDAEGPDCRRASA